MGLLLMVPVISSVAQNRPALIPYPQKLEIKTGQLLLPEKVFYTLSDSVLKNDVQWFISAVKPYKNTNWEMEAGGKATKALLEIKSSLNKSIGKNGYRLEIGDKIKLEGNGAGVFYGLQTLHQLIYESSKSGQGSIPKCLIEDAPRFDWRGMHLDECRHFFGINTVKKVLDLMAGYKLNTFHWHLTDDQGWRIEIKKYPQLMVKGAYRRGTMVGPYGDQKFDSVVYGGYYSQKEIKEIVEYAKKLHITVVPEIEMPGHAMAALSAYPELACFPKDFQTERGWGVFDDVFCTKKETFDFLYNVLNEVCDLFPGEFIHIGGDECPKTRWHDCGTCQSNIKEAGLKNEEELQLWFINKIKNHLAAKGRKIIGWDEILDGGPSPGAAIMSWRGESGGIAAAKLKQQVVMTPGSHCYFDHYQGQPQLEPLAIGGFTPVEKVYSYEPVPVVLNKEEAGFIMGAQANVWTEYILNEEQLFVILLPRLAALSEVLWGKNPESATGEFLGRFIRHSGYLQSKNIPFSLAMYQVKEELIKGDEAGSVKLSLQSVMTEVPGNNFRIMYINNKAKPQLYTEAIKMYSTTEIKAYVADENGRPIGKIKESKYLVNPATSAPISTDPAPSKYYPGKGLFTFNDSKAGSVKPRINSEWVGWDTSIVKINLDLGLEKNLSHVVISYLNDAGSKILAPDSLMLEYSLDGINFIHPQIKADITKPDKREFANFNLLNINARYLRLTFFPRKNPDEKIKERWFLCDEIFVK